MSNSLPHFCIVCTVLPSLKQHHHDVSQTPSEPLLRRFCSLPPPSPRDESDVELVSKLLLQHHNPFHATESSLQLHSITLTPTLLRLKNHSKIALTLFHCAKTLPKPPLSHSSYTLIIDTMAKIRQFDVHGNSSSKWTKATSPQPPLLS